MFQRLQQLPEDEAPAVVQAARTAPLAEPGVDYPPWYIRRWHFLPEGYLSRRGARVYDSVVRRIYTAGREGFAHRLTADWLRAAGARDVLELGAGPGRCLESLGRSLERARLSAIELSPYMVEIARQRRPSAALEHGDMTDTPWDDGAFDAVVAHHVLGHVPRDVASAALGEARRLLRPGGLLVVIDHAWHDLPLGGWTATATRHIALAGVRAQRLVAAPEPA